MWRNIYEEFALKLQSLADEFGRSLQDFINGLRLDRAHSWEAMLHCFLHDWRQRGILVDDRQRQALFKLLGNLRSELVPSADVQAAVDCWKRQAADARENPNSGELGEPKSPEEALLPPGVRQLGRGIMRRHPPESWLRVADDVLKSWRFAEGVTERFKTWMSREQGTRAVAINAQPTAKGDSTSSPGKNDGDVPYQLAMAPQETGNAAESDKKPGGKRGLGVPDSLSQNANHRPWVNFDRYMESDGMLYYRVDGQWWKVPVTKVKYYGKDEYDLEGAEKFEPSYLQDMLLDHGGWLDETGWDTIIEHYLNEYGASGYEQLRKDFASLDVVEAGKKNLASIGPAFVISLLLGAAIDKLRKIASPALRKQYDAIRKKMEALRKQRKNKPPELIEKEFNEALEELRDLADRETEAAAKRDVKAIADEAEDEYKKATGQAHKAADKENPRKRLPRSDGHWEGQPGNALWHSDIPELNKETGGKPVRFINGRPQLSEWSKETLKFEPGELKGTSADRRNIYDRIAKDKKLADANAAKDYLAQQGLTPHHASVTTIELVPTALHKNLPHIGSASDLRGGFE